MLPAPAGCSMDGSSKQKRAHHEGDDADDRLSDLPDALLHTIMSFLKARQMVQTCVLAKRWRHLWCSVPCLNLDLEEFKVGDKGVFKWHDSVWRANRENEEWSSFEDFTDNLLCCHNIAIGLLDTFRVCCGSVHDGSSARWFRRGIKHHPSWRIKTLHLFNIRLIDELKSHISSGCPALEDLQLRKCSSSLEEITSGSLVKLIIDNSDCLYHKLFMTTPALTSLHLRIRHGMGVDFLRVLHMPSLVDASVYLSTSSVNQLKFLGSLSNVTSLELIDFWTMVPDDESLKFPVFHNLKTLSLNNCDLSDDLQTLGHFLKNSPNLEKLTLTHCMYSRNLKAGKKKAKSKKTSSSQCHSLFDVQHENLNLTEILYDEDDVRLVVEFLLDNALNLPNNTIKLTRANWVSPLVLERG